MSTSFGRVGVGACFAFTRREYNTQFEDFLVDGLPSKVGCSMHAFASSKKTGFLSNPRSIHAGSKMQKLVTKRSEAANRTQFELDR
jgi:hypothetical protein